MKKAIVFSLFQCSYFTHGQIKVDFNNRVGIRTLNPTTEIETFGVARFGLSNGALHFKHNGQYGMPNLNHETCWGAELGSATNRYFDFMIFLLINCFSRIQYQCGVNVTRIM